MTNVNTKNWKFFEYAKIFDIKNGFYNKKPEASGDGKIPFIGASDKNHGITDYLTLDEIESSSKTGDLPNAPLEDKLFKPNAVCVTNNGSVGFAYYLDKEFTCSHDVNPLYRKNGEFNYYTGIFIATVIMYDRYRWGYGRKWRPKRMKFSKIKLPILCDNDVPIIDANKEYSDEGYIPDWEYMENFIKKLNYKIPETKNSLVNFSLSLSVENWETFILSELFDTFMGNGIDTSNTTSEEPAYNYVTRNRNNNGVVDIIDAIEGENPFSPGTMTLALGGSYLGSCYIQTKEFYTGQNVGILIPKVEISNYAKLFIATIIRMESRTKYEAFGRELNTHFRNDFSLKLPILRDNEGNPVIDPENHFSSKGYIPDWKFMEEYMRSLPNGDLL